MARHRFTRTQKSLNSQMNVVPYIDVMLVLLVIFMVTAPMITTGVEISLPAENTKSIKQSDLPVIISLQADGTLYVSHKNAIDEPMDLVALDGLLRQLYAENNELQVMLNADARNPYSQIMAVMARIQQAGISQVSLLSETKPTK